MENLPDWAPPFIALGEGAPIYLAAPAAELLNTIATPNHSERYALFLMCGVVEAIVRFLAIAAIAELTAENRGVLPQKLTKPLRHIIETPQFGTWREILDRTVAAATRPLKLIPELESARNDLVTLFRGGREDDENNLLGVRNAIAHDSLAQESRCEELVKVWGPRIGGVIGGLSWLTEIELWAVTADGYRRLNGPADAPAEPPPALAGISASAGDLLLTRGAAVVAVKPFGRYGPPREVSAAVPQIFVRRDRGRSALVFSLAGSRHALQAYETADLLKRFEEMFALNPAVPPEDRAAFIERDFDVEVNAAARAFEGRADDLAALLEAIAATPAGLVWVQGIAGSGKSFLMAKAATELEAAPPPGVGGAVPIKMLIYRFRADNGRCSPRQFLRWLVERLDPVRGPALLRTEDQRPDLEGGTRRLLDAAAELIATDRGERLVLFMDGLDELERRDANWSGIILERLVRVAVSTLFVASGQPAYRLPELMAQLGARSVFSGNLRPLTMTELRAIMDRRVPDAMRRIVAQDREGNGSRNAFISRLLDVSEGMPAYLDVLMHEIDADRFTSFDAGEATLLRRLDDAIHQELDRFGDSEVAYYATWIQALLALTREPLSPEVLAALAGRALGDPARALDLARRALGTLGSLLERRPLPSGDGFVLANGAINRAVRSYAAINDIRERAAAVLLAGALAPGDDAAAPYFLRYGIRHLIEAGRAGEAAELLSDADYLARRLFMLASSGGDAGIRADWSVLLATALALSQQQREWQNFWATDGSRFVGDEAADRCRDFIEAGLTYAPGTAVGDGVRAIARPPSPALLVPVGGYRRPGRTSAVLRGHGGLIVGAAELSNGRLLTWSEDGTLRLFEHGGMDTGVVMTVEGFVIGTLELSNQTLCSWSYTADYGSSRLDFWTLDGEHLREPLRVPAIGGAFEIADRGLLVWHRYQGRDMDEIAFRLYSPDGAELLAAPPPPFGKHYYSIDGALPLGGDRLLSWSGTDVLVATIEGELFARLPAFPKEVRDVRLLSSGRALISDKSDNTTLWTLLPEPSCVELGNFTDAQEMPDGTILAAGFSGLSTFDAGGRPLAAPTRNWTRWLRALRDGTLLSLAPNKTTLLISDTALKIKDRYRMGSTGGLAGAFELGDGNIMFWTHREVRIWDRTAPQSHRLQRMAEKTITTASAYVFRLFDEMGENEEILRSAGRVGTSVTPTTFLQGLKSIGAALAGRAAEARRERQEARAARRRDLAGLSAREAARLRRTAAEVISRQTGKKLDAPMRLASGRFLTLDVESGTKPQLWSVYGQPLSTFGDNKIFWMCVLPGERVLTWSFAHVFQRWRIDPSGEVPTMVEDGEPVRGPDHIGIARRLDGGRMVTTGLDGSMRFWTRDGLPIGEPIAAHATALWGISEISRDRMISWAANDELRLWTRDGALIRRHLIWDAVPVFAHGEFGLASVELFVHARLL